MKLDGCSVGALSAVALAKGMCADVEPQARRHTKTRHCRLPPRLDDWAANVFNVPMRKSFGILCCAVLAAGCASHNPPAPQSGPPKGAPSKPVLTPDYRPVGKVASVNLDGRFVILSFSPGEVPKAGERLNIYHNGLKVAEVKVDGNYQNNLDTAADIVQGDVQVGRGPAELGPFTWPVVCGWPEVRGAGSRWSSGMPCSGPSVF